MQDNILLKIKQDQKKILNLVARVEKTKNNSDRSKFFRKMKHLIVLSLAAEHHYLHHHFNQEKMSLRNLKALNTSDLDQHNIRDILQRMNLMNSNTSDWLAELKDLKQKICLHIKQEAKILS
mgnify:CR=1 FL=1